LHPQVCLLKVSGLFDIVYVRSVSVASSRFHVGLTFGVCVLFMFSFIVTSFSEEDVDIVMTLTGTSAMQCSSLDFEFPVVRCSVAWPQ
jgi:hypothetical protein